MAEINRGIILVRLKEDMVCPPHEPIHVLMLQVKPKLPGAKTGSRRFPDVTGGMDSGFSSCAVPAFCHGPGISKIGRYMRILRVAGKLQG